MDFARRQAAKLTVLIASAALLILAPSAAAAGTGSISGTVTEASSVTAIANIEVSVYEVGHDEFAPVGSATTNGSGAYTVTGLGPGSYKVRFSPPAESNLNFITQYWKNEPSLAQATPVALVEGEHVTGINAELHEGGTITGKVTDATAHGLQDAEVTVLSAAGSKEFLAKTTHTQANGAYSVAGLPAGTYEVEVVPPFGENLVPQFYADEPSYASGTQVPVKVGEKAEANVTLQVGGLITGRVTDAATHSPVAGVFVFAASLGGGLELFNGSAETNANGEYKIIGLATGTYTLEFFDEEGGSTEYITQTDSGIGVTQGSTTSGIDVALVPQAPTNTGSPTASGTATAGQTLSCSNGSWSGVSSITYAYKWLRDGSAIGGATGNSYVVQSADQGHGLACEVTATNSKGHASAKSNTLSVPVPSPPPPAPVATATLASTKVLVKGNVARVPITCNSGVCTGLIELVQPVVVKHRKGHRTVTRRLRILLGEVSFALPGGRSELLVVHLSKAGKHRLYATRHHRLSILAVVTVRGGAPTLTEPVLLVAAPVKRK